MNDPFIWLEEVEGEEQLTWVRKRNAHAEQTLKTSRYEELHAEILEVETSSERIPQVTKAGPHLYDFWTDAEHERGLWRRTTEAEFAKEAPEWEVLLDLDELAAAEGVNWVWHSATLLPPERERALVRLSRGGADAHVTREYSLSSRSFIEGGFDYPEAKGYITWADRSGAWLLAATDFGPDSLTTSGYPRTVRLWRRGTSPEKAKVIFTAEREEMGVWADHDFTEGHERTLIVRRPRFFEADYYLLSGEELLKLELPSSSQAQLHREWLLVTLREEWAVGGQEHPAGALIAIKLDAFLAGERTFTSIFTRTASTSLAQVVPVRNYVVLNVLDDVKSRLELRTPSNGTFKGAPLDVGSLAAASDEPLTLLARAVDAEEGDDLWVSVEGFLTPATLARVSITQEGAASATPLKRLPAFFDATDLTVRQEFTTSADGTRIPYFLVGSPSALAGESEPAPTLLYGYGGFQISLTPSYSGPVGRAWLARGGVFAVANIRGGGEYGPEWHRAAMRERRHRAYADFAAVADALVTSGVTSRERLGLRGGSNGGLLIGNMLMSYPDLFAAAVCQVPLLDMKRYSHLLAGASWIAEYGDPDIPEEWEFIRTFSPYHLHDEERLYPPILFTTSTRDDRVHPGHARKMAAKMLYAGSDVTYYENIEGGHGGAATAEQKATMQALLWEFLWQHLSGQNEREGAV